MKRTLFKREGVIYKANLHCHTTESDGAHTPEKIKELYQAEGYSIIAFTEHNKLVPQTRLNDDGFLALNSCEVSVTEDETDKSYQRVKTYHLNLYATDSGITDTPPLPEMAYDDTEAINQYIKNRNDDGFLVCYNHPYWSLQTYEDYSKLNGCFAMEIYNHSGEAESYTGYNPQAYDEMLRAGNRLCCVSADDNHNNKPLYSPACDSFGGWVMINSGSLRYEDVIAALKDGSFYASQGPDIHEITLENQTLRILCSDAVLIAVYTEGRGCYVKRGEKLNGAEFELNGQEGYIRVMCRDKNHKDANSNAYWL
jgi:hypothetical protein